MAVDRQHEPGQYPDLGGCSPVGVHEGSPGLGSSLVNMYLE